MEKVILMGEGNIDPRILEKSYNEAMELTISVAGYLRRREKIKATTEIAALHARENMRLSSCLMQVVAWFMVQKAVLKGEVSREEAASERCRLGGKETGLGSFDAEVEILPEEFCAYIERAADLYRRADRMDNMLYGQTDDVPHNAVHDMMDRIKNEKTP